jgi:hypothetical protein
MLVGAVCCAVCPSEKSRGLYHNSTPFLFAGVDSRLLNTRFLAARSRSNLRPHPLTSTSGDCPSACLNLDHGLTPEETRDFAHNVDVRTRIWYDRHGGVVQRFCVSHARANVEWR